MKQFTRSAQQDITSGKAVLVAKLSSNTPLLREVLLTLRDENVCKTEAQKDFLNNLCQWLAFNASFTPKQLPAAIQMCFQFKERVDAIIADLESDEDE